MAVLTPDRSEGKARFEGATAFYTHDDRADNKVSGVYSHRAIESSATEMERICDWARYVNEMVRFDVRNETGGELAAGTVVYVSGYDADESMYLVSKADADALATQPQFYLSDAIANNANGVAYNHTTVTGVDTSTATLGDPVYASGTAGEWTLTATPWRIGRVSVVNATTGEIEFHPAQLIDIPINFLGNSTASKTLTLGPHDLQFNFTAAGGTWKYDWTGAASGHLFELKQETGNVASGTHLLHVEATDADAACIHAIHNNAAGVALLVDGGVVDFSGADDFTLTPTNAGAIDNTVIGGTTAAAGTFTTLATTGNTNLGTSSPAATARLVVRGDGTNAIQSWENSVGSQVASLSNTGALSVSGGIESRTTATGAVAHTVFNAPFASGNNIHADFEVESGGIDYQVGRIALIQGGSNNYSLGFSTSNGALSERMRLTKDGDLLVGTSAATAAARLVVKGDGTNAIQSWENSVGTQVAHLDNNGDLVSKFRVKFDNGTINTILGTDGGNGLVGTNAANLKLYANNTEAASLSGAGAFNAASFSVGGVAGASFSGAVTNITVVNGIVTAAS